MDGKFVRFFICMLLISIVVAQRGTGNGRRPARPRPQSSSVSIIRGPQSGTWNVQQPSTQELTCIVSGPRGTRVRWEKDRVQITSDARRKVTSYPQNGNIIGSLQIRPIEKSDEGVYVCVADYRQNSVSSKPATLTIYGPPNVNQNNPLPQNISVAWNGAFSLQCDGKGPPDITSVSWTYKAFSDDEAQKLVFDGTNRRRLTDTRLRTLPREDDIKDNGVVLYQVYCTVYNSAGVANSRTTTIYIKRNPGAPVINRIVPLDLGRVATLFWNVGFDGYDDISTCVAQVTGSNGVSNSTLLNIDDPLKENKKFIVNLIPLRTYTIRIRCKNSVGASPWTKPVTFSTSEGFPDQAPKNIRVNAINSTSLNASWLPIDKDHIFGTLLGYKARLLKDGRLVGKIRRLGSKERSYVFTNLVPGQEYCFKILGYTSVKDGEMSSPECVTLPKSRLIPPEIIDINIFPGKVIFKYIDGGNEKLLLQNCTIVLHDPGDHEFRVRITVTKDLTESAIRNLPPNTHYEATIECYSPSMDPVDSKVSMFRTAEEKPRERPHGLKLNNQDQALLATWEHINITSLNGNFTGYNVCITAENSKMKCFPSVQDGNYTFSNVLPRHTYTISVAACTNAGCGPETYLVWTTPNWVLTSTVPDFANATGTVGSGAVMSGHFTNIAIVIAVAIMICIIIIAVAICFMKRKRRKSNENGVRVVYTPANSEPPYDQVATGLPASPSNSNTLNTYYTPLLANRPLLSQETLDKLSDVKFSRDRLILGERLGKGEFGRVYKGKFRRQTSSRKGEDEVMEVAVKTMIMHEYDASEREEFVKEGLRMQDMDHPNVMHLIGICLPEESKSNTASGDPRMSGYEAISPLVVVPYMENGDMKQYLYNARINDQTNRINLNKQLRFAYDIANGMEYLASRNIVHRDLACRNCMLDANMHVVVSDFGLSRQIYSMNYYRQKKSAKMPVKWMALESLLDRIFTSSTDVWSFGVTVWEIFTFCQNPYPGVQNHEMHELLKAGARLKQPKNCPGDIWNDAVYPCWDPRPDERPTFMELVDMFSSYLKSYPTDFDSETSPNPVYVNVHPPDEYESLQETNDPLLRSNTITSENTEIPIPYEEAVERLPSGKFVPKKGRDRSSSKRPLLDLKHNKEYPSSDEGDTVDL